jgi:dTDP-4-amino-4,6-dideoxygalactose transaminase
LELALACILLDPWLLPPRALQERGVPSRPYFTPIHLQPFYRQQFGYAPGDYPVTEELGRISLALPFSSIMTESQVESVCDALREVIEP